MPASAPLIMTADELLEIHEPDKWTELVRGRLVVREPPGLWHGMVSSRLSYVLGRYVYDNAFGELFAQDTGFKIASNPDTVRAPDIAFIARERLGLVSKRGYGSFAPDLVVEVLSPGDRPGEIQARVGDWLDSGVRLIWVIDPVRRQARIHRADGSLSVVSSDGVLDGEEVLPGFTCQLSPLLADPSSS